MREGMTASGPALGEQNLELARTLVRRRVKSETSAKKLSMVGRRMPEEETCSDAIN